MSSRRRLASTEREHRPPPVAGLQDAVALRVPPIANLVATVNSSRLPARMRPRILLGLADLIAGRRVDEGAAGLGEAIDDRAGDVGFGAVAPPGAEVARAQCQGRDAQAVVAAEGEVLHVSSQDHRAEFISHT